MRRTLALGVLLASAPASALTPVAQDRHVFARQHFEPGAIVTFQTLTAPDYAPFSASTNGGLPFPQFPMLAVQESSIDPERLIASGSSLASPGPGGESAPRAGFRVR